MQEQTCLTCGETKPLDAFTRMVLKCDFKRSNSSGHQKYCKKCTAKRAAEWRKKNPGYRGSGALSKYPKEDRLLLSAISARIHNANGNSKGKNLPKADIDKDYLYRLFKEQNGRCALSNVDLVLKRGDPHCLSLDKIIPEKGYVRGNVQWVTWIANRAKGELSLDQFIAMCSQVIDYQKVQRLSKGIEK